MAIGKEIIDLQSKLGYEFADITYLECALTHSSYTNEQRTRGINAVSNERLEFLGDAVLELVISERLYDGFRKYREGALTRMRQQLVCEKTLAEIAESLELGIYLNVGNGEEGTNCRHRPKVLADAMEAVIAAMYLDSTSRGDRAYRDVVLRLFEEKIESFATSQKTDYKTQLQQLAEQDGTALLEYRVLEESGPQHNRTFTVAAYVNNNEVGRGTASTKKSAEMQAARIALRLFGVIV
jgi:ribonuclease-3